MSWRQTLVHINFADNSSYAFPVREDTVLTPNPHKYGLKDPVNVNLAYHVSNGPQWVETFDIVAIQRHEISLLVIYSQLHTCCEMMKVLIVQIINNKTNTFWWGSL